MTPRENICAKPSEAFCRTRPELAEKNISSFSDASKMGEPIIKDEKPKETLFKAMPLPVDSKVLINPLVNDEKDKSMMASAYPEPQIEYSASEDLNKSVLSKSLLDQCSFSTMIDSAP